MCQMTEDVLPADPNKAWNLWAATWLDLCDKYGFFGIMYG